MAAPKKGQLAQFQCLMVDATDFATVESAITASDFNSGATVKFFGTNHGGSAATTSGTVSKIASLITSGLFRITLKTTENNYDRMSLRVKKTGCADQWLQWDNVDNDDSDIMSALTVIQSMASDAASAAVQTNSRVLLNQSRISDIASYLVAMSDVLSNAYSAAAQGTSQVLLVKSNVSDVQSYLVAMSGVQSDLYSLLSDLNSNILSRIPEEPASRSQLDQFNSDFATFIDARYTSTISRISDVGSDLRSYLVGMSDMLSNVQSALSDAHSDLGSKIGAITASVSASDISDIASAVWAAKYTANSNASSFGSLMKDNIYSLLSDLQSDFQSRVPKEVASKSLLSDVNSDLASKIGAITVTISASDVSDIASAVVAGLPITSVISDIYSLLSDLNSNFLSRIPKEPAARSQLSDMDSNLLSLLTGMSGMLSDTHSAATAGASRALLNQSRISDIQSFLSDFDSNFQSRVPKEVAARSQLSDLSSDLLSYVAGISNSISDVYSLLSDLHSDVGVVSGIQSDMYSLLNAGVEIGTSSLSDIRSAITANGVLVAGADPTGVVGVTDTIKAKIDWLTAMSRNELTQTSTSAVLKNDAGTAIASATLSDDTTTFTRGEWH